MSEQKTPKGMITLEVFASRKNLAPDKVIKMIKDGFYVGRVVGEQWFVDSAELSGAVTTSKIQKGTTYHSEYSTARKISMLISFLGWVVFAGGVIAAFSGMARGLLTSLPGLGIAVSGLFLVAAGQVTRATVDNADHTREILNHLQEKV